MSAAASAEEKNLFLELFRDYVPDVRPRLNPHETITVTIDFEVNQIKELVSSFHTRPYRDPRFESDHSDGI